MARKQITGRVKRGTRYPNRPVNTVSGGSNTDVTPAGFAGPGQLINRPNQASPFQAAIKRKMKNGKR